MKRHTKSPFSESEQETITKLVKKHLNEKFNIDFLEGIPFVKDRLLVKYGTTKILNKFRNDKARMLKM